MDAGGFMNNKYSTKHFKATLALLLLLIFFATTGAYAAIDGVNGTSPTPAFSLTAKAGHISVADGGSIFMWGYAYGTGPMQYPGPTLIVNQNDTVTVTLTNTLAVPVSIVFPGQGDVVATGGVQGLLTREAPPGGSVTYTFTAANPGTYAYYSGTKPDIQVEMGLVGALIIRPATNPATQAYNDVDPDGAGPLRAESAFDHEYLFLLSEVDPVVHQQIEQGRMNEVDTTKFFPVYWFINGRAGPDTMLAANVRWLPNQPYNAMPMMHPGERILMRMIGTGRDSHPYHTHGNHHRVIARQGRLLESSPGVSGPDLAEELFTSTVVPGESVDATFTWTGAGLGWDIYGAINATCTDTTPVDGLDDVTGLPCHDATCTDVAPADGLDDATKEYCADHGKPFPVILPDAQDLTFGQFYSGSPFLGALGALPPGEGGFNPNGGYFYMWHSHNEKEIINFDIFPGGMLTMMLIEHPSVMLMNP